jgi:hypothetical protein
MIHSSCEEKMIPRPSRVKEKYPRKTYFPQAKQNLTKIR